MQAEAVVALGPIHNALGLALALRNNGRQLFEQTFHSNIPLPAPVARHVVISLFSIRPVQAAGRAACPGKARH